MKTMFAGKPMRRAAISLLCAASLALPALALGVTTGIPGQDQTQGPPPPPPDGQGMGGGHRGGAEERAEMLKHELNLTPDQFEQVKAIVKGSREQMMALRNSTDPQPDRREKMRGIMEGENARIKSLLNDEQKAKFDAMQARMRERMRDHHNGEVGPPPPPPPPAQ